MNARWLGSTGAVAAAVAVLALGTGAWAQGKWAAPPEAKNVKNAVAKSDKVIADAKKIAEANCVACHGAKGVGDGAAAAALPVKPANWTTPAVQGETDGDGDENVSRVRVERTLAERKQEPAQPTGYGTPGLRDQEIEEPEHND